MPSLTALRRAGAGKVALDVDGTPWRVVPDDVVVRCRLAVGVELDRGRLRDLRRELRRAEAVTVAARVLERRDLAERRLDERLQRRGVPAGAREAALDTLKRAGIVDDARLARSRAAALAARGWGDGALEARLEADGLPQTAIRQAVAALEPEPARAVRTAAGLSAHRASVLLARRGFAPETIEDVVGPLDGAEQPG